MATNVALVRQYAALEKDYPPPAGANAVGMAQEPNCSDLLTIHLRVSPRRYVEAAGFTLTASACDTVRACAVKCCQLAEKKAVLASFTGTADDIAHALSEDGTPDQEHIHCAQMAELALKRAVVAFSRQCRDS